MPLTNDIHQLKKISFEIRRDVIRSLAEAGSGHLGGSLGLADIFTCLYFKILNHKPGTPDWELRDRLILSIGHVAPVFYAALAHSGYFDPKELMTLRKLGSRLQGHPGKEHGLPGIELSAGSLGQGLSVAVGLALAGKMDHKTWNVFSVHGDGELQEGAIWEAAMSASHHQLNNLVALVDRNYVQIDGKNSEVMEIEPLKAKFESFGWKVLSCNGHKHQEIIATCQKAMAWKKGPVVILARTRMGKGVKSIEDDYRWHGKPPKPEQVDMFIKELEQNQE
ncbi:MAG: transketolase [Bacteroidales bacterium]|jgi:transketolase|nr:transketolase [Bacteroidales bacterium]